MALPRSRTIRVVNVEEQTLPPVLMMRHHIGQQLRNLVHELFVECRRLAHPRDATPTPQPAYQPPTSTRGTYTS